MVTPTDAGPKGSGQSPRGKGWPSVEESDLGSKDFDFPGEAAPRVASDATWWPRPLLLGLQLLSQRGLTYGPPASSLFSQTLARPLPKPSRP